MFCTSTVRPVGHYYTCSHTLRTSKKLEKISRKTGRRFPMGTSTSWKYHTILENGPKWVGSSYLNFHHVSDRKSEDNSRNNQKYKTVYVGFVTLYITQGVLSCTTLYSMCKLTFFRYICPKSEMTKRKFEFIITINLL